MLFYVKYVKICKSLLLLFAGSRNLIGEKNSLSRAADLSNVCLISGMLKES